MEAFARRWRSRGQCQFRIKTGLYYREKIEFAFFMDLLKGKGDGKFPRAWVFETGTNQWRTFDQWPPKSAASEDFFIWMKRAR